MDTPLLWHHTCALDSKGRLRLAEGTTRQANQDRSTTEAIPLPGPVRLIPAYLTRAGAPSSGSN
jgi:hypothetical protein